MAQLLTGSGAGGLRSQVIGLLGLAESMKLADTPLGQVLEITSANVAENKSSSVEAKPAATKAKPKLES